MDDQVMTQPQSPIAKADDPAMTVRFPPGMLDRLDVEAQRAGRSRNTEIVHRLTESLNRDRKPVPVMDATS